LSTIARKKLLRAFAVFEPHDLQPSDPRPAGEDDDRWLFEFKWDGYRAIATVEKDAVTLTSRNGLDLLPRFPEMVELASAFRSNPVVVDGELCVLDGQRRPDFQALQSRDKPVRGLTRRKPSPVTYFVFDLIYADGRDIRERPCEERKGLLERLTIPDHLVMYSKHVIGKGKKLFAVAQRRGLEGIIGKVRLSHGTVEAAGTERRRRS
jgi:bifunctional non-homologous end joining protein LigD